MSRLQGKYALITGGTSGIGLETARQFIAEGATVAITGRSQRALDAAGQALAGNALLLLSDAGDIPQQRALAQQLEQRWPRLDVLYVNAGDVTHRPLQEWDEQSYQRLMDINLKGPFFLIQALLPLLANPSSVILCGSVSAHIGLPQSSAYAASKAGLLSLARTLSGELHARGIRVNGWRKRMSGPCATISARWCRSAAWAARWSWPKRRCFWRRMSRPLWSARSCRWTAAWGIFSRRATQ